MLALVAILVFAVPAAPAVGASGLATPATAAVDRQLGLPSVVPSTGHTTEAPRATDVATWRRTSCVSGAPTVGGSKVTVDAEGMPRVRLADVPLATSCAYVVRLKPGASEKRAIRRLPTTAVSTRFGPAAHGFAAHLTDDQVADLRADPMVVSVTPDWVMTIADTQASPPWGLDRIDQQTLPLSGSYDYEASAGAGVTAYVVDTGIRATHEDFGGRVASGVNLAPDGSGTDDCHGHGTHVAGTVGGASYGVAKAVTLVPVRVLDCGGSAPMSTIVAGLDWIIADHAAGGPAVANLSIGGPPDVMLNDAIASTVADGVVVVVAAGNSNADACGSSPAGAPEAITVAATNSSDARAGFSNNGPCVDLFAPGVDIPSAGKASDTATATMSGTSMASPHVAGIAAILLGRYLTADPASIAAAIIDDATTNVVGDPAGSPNRLAHVEQPVPGAQSVHLALPSFYVSDPPVTLSAISTSGEPPTFTSLTPFSCTVAGAVVTPVAKGTCTIRASVAGGGGWAAAHVDRSTTVYVARQTISVPVPWAEFTWGSSNDPGGTASSGLPVTYQPQSTACQAAGGSLVGAEVGDCLVAARQAGNATFGPAPPAYFWRSVVPADQALTGPPTPQVPVGASVPYSGASTRDLPVDVHSATPATCSIGGAELTGIALGACGLRLTQAGSAGVRPTGSASLRAVSSATPTLTRVAIRDDGRPVVAFSTGSELRLLVCDNPSCSNPAEKVLADIADRYSGYPDASGLGVADLAIVVADGRPVVAYSEAAPRQKPWQESVDIDFILRVAACVDPACSGWTDTIVDDPDPLADLAVNTVSAAVSDGLPVLVYGGDNFGGRLYACADVACTSGVQRDIRSTDPLDYPVNPTVTIDGDGLPVIAYLRLVQEPPQYLVEEWAMLVLVRCHDPTCASSTRSIAGEAMRWYKPAVVVPADDRPVLFWTENENAHAGTGTIDYRVMRGRCDDPTCSSFATGAFDDEPVLEWNGTANGWSAAGFDVSAALGPDGLPRVGYLAWVRRVPSTWQTWGATPWVAIVAACTEADCATAERGFVDEWSRTGGWIHRSTLVPIAVGADGRLVTAFGMGPAAYSSEDARVVGVRLATCSLAVCGTEAAAVVTEADQTAPSSTAPLARLRTGATLSGTAIPVTLRWSGDDTGSGVARYELERSDDDGTSWTAVTTVPAPETSVSVATATVPRFRVRAVDNAGNVGAWAEGAPVDPGLVQQSSASVTYGGGWKRATSRHLSGGSSRYAKDAGSTARYVVTSRAIALVTTKAPRRGRVRIYVDGRLEATVNLRASAKHFRVLAWQHTWTSAARHRVRLVVVGAGGRPRVDLDAFALLE